MVKNFDHVTIVVTDVERAKEFFQLLGFEEDKFVVIAGDTFSGYMGIENIEAEHHTLVLAGSSPRCEIQLLKFVDSDPIPNPNIEILKVVGFNHICFAVDDVKHELEKLATAGFETRNDVMDFHDRKLVFLRGPEGVTIELAEWHDAAE